MKNKMSQGLGNKLLENKKIYTICLSELKDESNKYPAHFTYPESLEFSMNFIVLRKTNLRRLKEVIININRHIRNWKNYVGGFSKKELGKIRRRKLNRKSKLNKHLTKLRALRVRIV